jgi:DNA-directed RNA polymerase specialized sigma24 family protein
MVTSMETAPKPAISQMLRSLVISLGHEQACDQDLLKRFVEVRDEAAFAALVLRHAAMVRGVGLRVQRHRQDAEDVCQATFLLLARKAAAISWRDSITNWLYGVARHLALNSKRGASKRKAREGQVQHRTVLTSAWTSRSANCKAFSMKS